MNIKCHVYVYVEHLVHDLILASQVVYNLTRVSYVSAQLERFQYFQYGWCFYWHLGTRKVSGIDNIIVNIM